MCGIFALLNNEKFSYDFVYNEFVKGKKRGPESSKLNVNNSMKTIIGFHRLAINGLDSLSDQPFQINDIILVCNGEIYNYKSLYKSINVDPVTNSDCEVIIHLYIKYGIEQTLIMLDGVYSFVLFDNRITSDLTNKVYVARDPYGVRPLYKYSLNCKLFGFASDLKCLTEFYKVSDNGLDTNSALSLQQFLPGTYSSFELSSKVSSRWVPEFENKPHFIPTFSYSFITPFNFESNGAFSLKNRDEVLGLDVDVNLDVNLESRYLDTCYKNISYYLCAAITKRCTTTERPVACLLSGGLDSSLISALVADHFRKEGKQIETYSIGLAGSVDLKNAKIVAKWIGSKHTEVVLEENDMIEAIPEVINAIESYDTTTVRASIGNYLIGKYIAKNSDAKVIFNGDGSDELLGGYLYMGKCPDDVEFDKECRRLLKDLHAFDVLRSDKSISSNGLEPRTPFLDRGFVNYVLSIPPYFRNHMNFGEAEKFLLRRSFSKNNYVNSAGEQIIPDEILNRKKEAFSDGVSCQGRSLYVILQEAIANKLNQTVPGNKIYEPNIASEKTYYKMLFEDAFGKCGHVLPYFWMPKYTDATDPSARTLTFYSD